MLLNGKTITQITEGDLISLIDNRREDQFIDYKNHVYKTSREHANAEEKKRVQEKFKLDLCEDVCAFANAYGGWIICGMDESDDSSAKELIPLRDFNPDDDVRRLQAIIESGTSPSIRSFDIKPVSLSSGGHVLVIYVQRSYASPHRVIENRKFRVRRLNENGEMDMQEIRRSFVGNTSYADQIRDFRRKRVEAILDFNHPDSLTGLKNGPLFAVHILPLGMVEEPNRLTFNSFDFAQNPLGTHQNYSAFIARRRFNLDGFLLPDNSSPQASEYFQIYRSGAIEYVKCFPGLDSKNHSIPIKQLEPYVLSGIAYCVRLLKSIGIDEPCYAYLTLARINGYKWGVTGGFEDALIDGLYSPTQDPLFLQELYIEAWQERVEPSLKTLLDIWSNSIGLSKSQSYDSNGTFINKHHPTIPSTTL